MKGPVAIAGSIPFLSNSIGIEVPINAATTITQSIESEIVILNSMGSLLANPNIIVKIPNTEIKSPKIWNLFVFSILNIKHSKIIIAGIAVLNNDALITWVWIKAKYVNELNKPTLVKAKKNNKGKLFKITLLYLKISL